MRQHMCRHDPSSLTKLGSLGYLADCRSLDYPTTSRVHGVAAIRHHVPPQDQAGMAHACHGKRRLRSNQRRVCETVLLVLQSRPH
jgi:hypothetical protein